MRIGFYFRRLRCRLSLAVILLCFVIPNNAAEETLQLYYTDFPPFTMRHDNGEAGGLFLDYFSYMLHISDVAFITKYYPPKRWFKNLTDGINPIVTTMHDSINTELYYVSNNPVLTFELRLYWLADSNSVKDLGQLSDTNLGVILGYNYGGLLSKVRQEEQNLRLRSIAGTERSLDLLKIGRVEYLLNYTSIMEYNFSEDKLQELQSSHISTLSFYVGVRKNLNNASDILHRLEQAYIIAQENGTVEKSIATYISH